MTSAYDDSIWELIPTEPREPNPALAALAAEFTAGAAAVLDLGCGDGTYLPSLAATAGDLYAADRSAVAIERARLRCASAKFVNIGPGQRIPLDDNIFDRVWFCDTLEHVVDTQTVLSEIRRVLRPGGELLVVTPDHPRRLRLRLAFSGWERHFDPFSPHLRFYTARSLGSALVDCGFERPRINRLEANLVARAKRL
jgi:ubiquinone/menaquinone biosynthesis C-methylase UbiE